MPNEVKIQLLAQAPLATATLGMPIQANAQRSANADSPATIAVSIPRAAMTASVVMLEIAITGIRIPLSGHGGAVVWLDGMEVGRLSIGPYGRKQRYQLNIGTEVWQLGLAGKTANVVVAIIDRGGGNPTVDGGFTISSARVVLRS